MIIGISGKIGSGKDTVANIIMALTSPYKDQSFEERFKMFKETGFLFTHSDKPIWQIKKFADKLKQIVALLIGCEVKDLEKEEFKNSLLPDEYQHYRLYNFGKPTGATYDDLDEVQKICKEKSNSQHQYTYVRSERTVRWLLQYMGTELLRDQFHENIHINALFADYKCLDDTLRASMGNVIDYSACPFPNWLITDVRFPNEAEAIKKRKGILIRVHRTMYLNVDGHITPVQEVPKEERNKYLAVSLDKHPSETYLDGYQGFDFLLYNEESIDELVLNVRTMLQQLKIIE